MLRAVVQSGATDGGVIGGGVSGGTAHSVLFVDTNGNLGQDNNQFYFNDAASGSASYVQLSVGVNGDFSGTDSINIYGQYDAYNPNSVVNGGAGQAANMLLDGLIPGVTASSSRGNGATPVILNTGDFIGAFSAWGYTGSSPAYVPFGSMLGVARGATAANLGGELQFWTKADNGNLTQQATLNNLGLLGVGVATPTTRVHIGGALSSAAWGVNGILFRIGATTVTDTSSSGAVSGMTAQNVIASQTIAANSSSTYALASSFYIAAAPTAGTNATITNNYSLYVATGNSALLGAFNIIGSGYNTANTPAAAAQVEAGNTQAYWGTNGCALRVSGHTMVDSTSSGATAAIAISAFANHAIGANSSTTYATASTLYIAGAPSQGSNVTITLPLALNIASGLSSFSGGLAIGNLPTGTTGLELSYAYSGAYWGAGGCQFKSTPRTNMDTSSSGGVGIIVITSFGGGTIAASNVTTYTQAASVYIAGPPTAGTNVTITNPFALIINSGILLLNANNSLQFANQTNGAAAQIATMTNGPVVGNPNFWLPVIINGSNRFIPAW